MLNEVRKKEKILVVIAIITLVLAAVGATLAYFVAQGGDRATTNVNVVTSTTDNLSFQVGSAINITASQDNFGEGDGNQSGNTYARAILTAGNSSSSASASYYVYLDITSNDFIYTTEGNTAELILTITGPEGDVTELDGLNYVTVGEVSGFDITTKEELITIASEYEITTSSSITQNWTITVTLVNLETDQNENTNKNFNANLIIQEEPMEGTLAYHETCDDDTLACYIATQYNEDGSNNIYYHDGEGTYGELEAGDNSYRYAGANPDNYVCFGYDYDTTNSCPTDNLYRIIGLFDDGEGTYNVKLIKYDYATSTQLGTGGAYSGTESASSYSGTYKGELETLYWYYWNNSTSTNTWADSNLNTENLNGNYLTYLDEIDSKWTEMIEEHTWVVGGNTYANIVQTNAKNAYGYEITNPSETTTLNAKIGLMYVSDYYYSASPTYWTYPGYSINGASYDYRAATGSNWIYMGLYEWTISRDSDNTNDAFLVYSSGFVNYNIVDGNHGVRPSFYLASSVKITGGSGSATDPFRISD